MKFLIGFILGLFLGFGVYWYLDDRRVVSDTAGRPAATSGQETSTSQDIRDELGRTGNVIREKAREAGDAIGEVADNTATTAAVKGKLLQDPGTSGLAIDVDSDNGVVTLSGKVSSHEEIARAMDLAMGTRGVRKVISALHVEADAPQTN